MAMADSLLAEVGARISGNRNTKVFKQLYMADKTVDVNVFHEKCDSKGPTVTLLYGKHNTLFGGYTSQNWLSTDKLERKKDADAFLFYKNSFHSEKCCFMPIKKGEEEKAIICQAKFGPTFGGSSKDTYDLQVFKHDSQSQSTNEDTYMVLNGMLKPGKCYEVSNPKETKNEINSGKLEVTRVEVFQVLDDELKDKWRDDLQDFEMKKEELINMEPNPKLGVKQYNILLVGAVGSGKSSFCNTLGTVFSEDATPFATTGSAPKSVTNKKKEYDLVTKEGKTLKIRIIDIRGMEDNRGLEHEFHLLLDGKLPPEFQFSENEEPIKEDQLIEATLNEEIHLVCFVTGHTAIDTLTSNLRTHFELVKKKNAEKGLPLSVVVTKMDEICPVIAEDVDHIYRCAKARDATYLASEFFGIPQTQVFPVVNYTGQDDTKRGFDRLALQALYKMYRLVQANLSKHEAMSKPQGSWEDRDLSLSVRQKFWREPELTMQRTALTKELSKFDDKQLRILCFGPSRSGKSSFIDSVLSTFRHKICSEATRGDTDEASATAMFQLYPIKYLNDAGDTKRSNIYLADMPGIQEEGGIQFKDAKLIVKGHVANKCKIRKGVLKDSKKFITKPQPKDRIHCVCFVFDLSAVDKLSHPTFRTMCCRLKSWLSERGVPFVVVVTKCDIVSEAIKQNPARVFDDTKIKEYKDKLVESFKVKENKIFPVQNYVGESNTVPQIEVLLLEVIKEVLSLGYNYLEDFESDEETDDDSDDNGSECVKD